MDSQTGTLSGTPTELGNFSIIIGASDAAGNVFDQPLTLAVKKLVVTTKLLPDAFVGQRYAATLKAMGGHIVSLGACRRGYSSMPTPAN
ncbi:MAG: hypothetical protein HY314_09695 [Acidobacteria bacterium]|nr:hypothetical protein [Acidobacteriota bacterium]